MFRNWIERLISREREPIELTRVIVRPVRREPWTKTEPASGTVPIRKDTGRTLRSGPLLESTPAPSRVPADLLLMNELAQAERDLAELRDLEAWIAEEDVRSDRLRAEEDAVLGLLKRNA